MLAHGSWCRFAARRLESARCRALSPNVAMQCVLLCLTSNCTAHADALTCRIGTSLPCHWIPQSAHHPATAPAGHSCHITVAISVAITVISGCMHACCAGHHKVHVQPLHLQPEKNCKSRAQYCYIKKLLCSTPQSACTSSSHFTCRHQWSE
jgi:hypothetical protein